MADEDRELEASLTAEELRLAERLRTAREFVGLTQDAVAKALGVPRSAVSAMEKGKRKVVFLELQQLARLYRQPLSFFSDERDQNPELPPSDELSRALYRVTQKLPEKDRNQVLLFARFLRNAGADREIEEEDAHAPQQKNHEQT
jgi:transcriptional regulator with XRE-family HTH domain